MTDELKPTPVLTALDAEAERDPIVQTILALARLAPPETRQEATTLGVRLLRLMEDDWLRGFHKGEQAARWLHDAVAALPLPSDAVN